jgi:hypothetical protein
MRDGWRVAVSADIIFCDKRVDMKPFARENDSEARARP